MPKAPVRHRPGIEFFLGLSLGVGRHLSAGAQELEVGLPAVFRTGTTPERITQSVPFPPDVVGAGPTQLGFEIGFSTEETILDSGFLDSFTLSATGGANGESAVLLTLDGFGAAPLPESPGALLLAPSSLRLTPIIGQFTAPNAQTTLAFSGVWDLGIDRAWTSGPKKLTSGWRFSPIVTYRTGLPLTVYAGISRSRTRTGPSGAGDPNLVRANLVAPITYFDPHNAQLLNKKNGNFYFDPAAFSTAAFSAAGFDPVNNPSQRTYGTLGRNAFRGPDRFNANISVGKNTVLIGENKLSLEVRADFFNVLNQAQFNNPSTTFTSGTFGQISSTGDPRIIQLSGRFTF